MWPDYAIQKEYQPPRLEARHTPAHSIVGDGGRKLNIQKPRRRNGDYFENSPSGVFEVAGIPN